MVNLKNILSKKNPEEEAKALGKKIVLLLKASDLPEDVQLAIIQLIPEMSLEQIDELVKLLSLNVMRGGEGDQKLKEKLTAIKEKYDTKKDKLADSVMKDLDNLEKEIE